MEKSALLLPKRPKPPRGRQQVKNEFLSDHESLSSSSASVNPISLMLGAFSAMKEDEDEGFCAAIIKHTSTTSSPSSSCDQDFSHTTGTEFNTESSYSHSQKPQPASPGTPTTAVSSVQSPASSLSFLGVNTHKQNPWQWVPSSDSTNDEVEGGDGTNNRRVGRKKLAPHILQELELAPLMDSSQSSFSVEDSNSVSSSLVVASVALEITGDFVDDLIKNHVNKLIDDDNSDESSRESDRFPQIPREIVLYSKNHLSVDYGEQEQQHPHQQQNISASNASLSGVEGDLPLRSRTHSEEYEVVSL